MQLTVENLNFNYINDLYTQSQLLSNINFKVISSELLHICGINGSGKTTLLKLLAGLITPNSGKIHYQNQDIHMQQTVHHCCYIGHKTGIHQILSGYEYYKFTYNLTKDNLKTLLCDSALLDIAHTPIAKLSFGQRHRMALFRLILTQAKVWLLDEPFVGLDQNSSDWLNLKLKQHLSIGGIVILTSHHALPTILQPYQVYSL